MMQQNENEKDICPANAVRALWCIVSSCELLLCCVCTVSCLVLFCVVHVCCVHVCCAVFCACVLCACMNVCVCMYVCVASCVRVNLQETDLARPSITCNHTLPISRSNADTETNRSSTSKCTDSFTATSFEPVAYALC